MEGGKDRAPGAGGGIELRLSLDGSGMARVRGWPGTERPPLICMIGVPSSVTVASTNTHPCSFEHPPHFSGTKLRARVTRHPNTTAFYQ